MNNECTTAKLKKVITSEIVSRLPRQSTERFLVRTIRQNILKKFDFRCAAFMLQSTHQTSRPILSQSTIPVVDREPRRKATTVRCFPRTKQLYPMESTSFVCALLLYSILRTTSQVAQRTATKCLPQRRTHKLRRSQPVLL